MSYSTISSAFSSELRLDSTCSSAESIASRICSSCSTGSSSFGSLSWLAAVSQPFKMSSRLICPSIWSSSAEVSFVSAFCSTAFSGSASFVAATSSASTSATTSALCASSSFKTSSTSGICFVSAWSTSSCFFWPRTIPLKASPRDILVPIDGFFRSGFCSVISSCSSNPSSSKSSGS